MLRHDYEKLIISCLLNNKDDCLSLLRDQISPSDFKVAIYSDIYAYYLQNEVADINTAALVFKPEILLPLLQNIGNTNNIQTYIDGLKKCISATSLSDILKRLSDSIKASPDNLNEAISFIQNEVSKISINENISIGIENIMHQVVDELENIKAGKISGVSSGIPTIDEIFKTFSPGLYIIAGRPHMGKTSFLLQLAESIALQGHKVLFASLEDGNHQMIKILLANRLKMRFKSLMDGLFRYDEMYEAANHLSQLGISFLSKRISPLDLRRHLIKNREHTDIIFIDQLSYMKCNAKISDRRLELNSIIRDIKELAIDFKVPIFLASQLNRGLESRQDKRPFMADLKETGSLEEDADAIFLLYRDAYYNPKSENILEVNICKNKKTYETATIYGKLTDDKTMWGRADG